MPTIIKPEILDFKPDNSALADFNLKTLSPRLSNLTNSQHFKFDIRQLEPDTFSFPYHFHRNAEELIVILSGCMTMRSPNGLQIINQGEIVFFEMGESSAHQFYNHTSETCTYLDLRTTLGIDISEYPDSGKINVLPEGDVFLKGNKVDYNHGEENVRDIWDNLSK